MSWSEENFIRHAKFCTVWPMARYMRQDLPERPESLEGHPLLFSGRILRFLKNRIISLSGKNTVFWGGVLQGVKRGCYPAPASYVHKTMVKHRAALSTPSPVKEEDLMAYEPYAEYFFSRFRAEARLLEASTSASWESMRSEGGARDFIRPGPFSEEFLGFAEISPGKVVERRGVWEPTFSELLDLAEHDENLPVMVSAVLEPLKVRLITKGSSRNMHLSRFYQKDLWNYLYKYPQFRLLGTTLDASHLDDILRREESSGLTGFDQWVSGDYSSATDNLSIDFTKLFFEESLANCADFIKEEPWRSREVADVLRSVLYEQMLHYPPAQERMGGLSPVLQENGQLMGSVLSFPILCAINLCAYWRSIVRYIQINDPRSEIDILREVPFWKLPVLVNGDDILFRSNEVHYQIWQEEIKRVGFSLSLGKNYIHPTILTVNSQIYQHIPSLKIFRKRTYLNTGLLLGQSKVTGRDNARVAPIWDWYDEVVEGAAAPRRAHRRFLFHHRDRIRDLTKISLGSKRFHTNIFLDREVGGLGFRNPGVTPNYTRLQTAWSNFQRKRQLERVARSVPPTAPFGVRVETVDRVPLPHGELSLGPVYGPYPEGNSPFSQEFLKEGVLEKSKLPIDKSTDLKYTHPAIKQVREFFSSPLDCRHVANWNFRTLQRV